MTNELTNEQLNEALEHMGKSSPFGEAKVVELDDTIKFNCKRCGKCCSCREDIILNPYDVYHIAQGLNTTPEEVLNKYCTIFTGANSCLPIVVLKEDERGLCPFLKFFPAEGKFGCSINDFKPGVCALHPIGIVRSAKQGEDNFTTGFIEVPSCSTHGTDTEIKIRDFIKSYLDNFECHEKGSKLTLEAMEYINPVKFVKGLVEQDEAYLEENFSEEEIKRIKDVSSFIGKASYAIYIRTTIQAMYDFDMNKGFLEQFDDIKANIKENCLKMISVLSLLGIDFSSGKLTDEDKELLNVLEQDHQVAYEQFCEKMEQEEGIK